MTCDEGPDLASEDATNPEPPSAWRRARRAVSRVRPWVWALPCAAVAVLYAVVWPASKVTSDTTTPSYLLLRWGHSVTWVLLAISFMVRNSTIRWRSRVANLFAVAALVMYAAFLYAAT